MAIQKIIRGVEGEAFSRWELPSVDEPRPAPAPAVEEPVAQPVEEAPPVPSVAEIEALQQRAYDEGFALGKQEGFAAGHQEGFAAGHAEGVEAGRRDGQAEAQREGRELAARFKRMLDTLAAPLRELDDAVEDELVRMTMLLASQIIRRELQTQPGEILACVREAVALLPVGAREVKVHVHPDDARFLRETLGEGEAPAWQLVEDPTLSRGGCRVLTASSHIDATLERRLAALARDLLGGERAEDAAG